MIKRLLSFVLLISLTFAVLAQPAGYYDNATGKTGADLKAALHGIIDGHTEFSYTQVWEKLMYTDEDPNNSNNVICLYTGWSILKSNHGGDVSQWNREHTWAKSHGNFGENAPAGTDLHHLRPTDVTVNSARGNLDFDSGGTIYIDGDGATLCKKDGDSWEPWDEVKGDVARIILYMDVRYEGDNGEPELKVVDNVNTEPNTSTLYGEHGKLSTLLQWHINDPVSDWERRRNNRVYEFQNNRNPFIDHPEYVNEIWGGGTATLSFTSSPITTATQGQSYSYAVKVTGPVGATFAITAPTKPEWLTLTSTGNGTATLSGTPSAAGSDNVTLSVNDGTTTKTQSFTIQVAALEGLKFTSSPVLSATTGNIYSYSVVATNQSSPSATITLSTPNKPSWVTLTSTGNGTATLSGTPSSTGADNVTLSASDGTTTVNQSFTIAVEQAGLTKVETFTNISAASSSYSDRTWTGDDGSTWTATQARTDEVITTSNKAICLKNIAGTYVQSGSLTGGCASVSFKVKQAYTGTGGTLTLYINGVQVGSPFAYTSEPYQVASFPSINIASPFVIKLVNNGTARPVIDDVTWTGYSNVNVLPTITSITTNPLSPTTDDDVVVSATISDSDGSIQQAWLEWGTTASNLNNDLPMTLDGAVYKATIPAQAQAGTIYLSINARDNSNDISTALSSIAIVQNQPPVITNITNIPFSPTVGEAITISSNVTDIDGTIQEVWLDWGNASNNLSNRINMTYLSGSYMATIPAQTQAGIIYLAVSAKDNLLATASTPFSFTLSSGTFVNHDEDNSRIKVYPNPAKNQISVEVQELNSARITISNIIGETLISLPFNGSKQTLDISGLKSGVYFVVVIGERFKNTTRIVVY